MKSRASVLGSVAYGITVHQLPRHLVQGISSNPLGYEPQYRRKRLGLIGIYLLASTTPTAGHYTPVSDCAQRCC